MKRRAHAEIYCAASALHVAFCSLEGGFGQGDLSLGVRACLLGVFTLRAQGGKRRVDVRFGGTQVLEGGQRVAVVHEGGLALGNGGARVRDERVEDGGFCLQTRDVGKVGGNRADCRAEAVADRI